MRGLEGSPARGVLANADHACWLAYAVIGFDGDMDMALALRTMVVPTAMRKGDQWTLHLQAGAGRWDRRRLDAASPAELRAELDDASVRTPEWSRVTGGGRCTGRSRPGAADIACHTAHSP